MRTILDRSSFFCSHICCMSWPWPTETSHHFCNFFPFLLLNGKLCETLFRGPGTTFVQTITKDEGILLFSRCPVLNQQGCILNEIVVPHCQRHREKYFEQDGATAHYSCDARNIQDQHLNEKWIGRRGQLSGLQDRRTSHRAIIGCGPTYARKCM